tara:strand:+ start:18832 stop:19104 length:273 start_codon:yes stop_codon:yes gene_type:complete
MNVKWEDVKADYARKDAEIEKLKVMNSKLENSLERVLNAVQMKKPTVQHDPLVAMNAELVELIGEMNVGYSADIRADELIKRAKELNHEG